jgi:hypothetical protein
VKGKYLPIFRMDAMDSELVHLLSQVRAMAKPSFQKSKGGGVLSRKIAPPE